VSESLDVPYLSVVVTSRNDDHGGDPLVRLETLLRTFSAQCERTGLRAELVVVEWNPPADRPSLKDQLQRPDPCFCDVRFIEVPPEVHQTLKHADVLPLFQMIAKNVGIRRARGRFILATNIDIVFSDALVDYLAQGRLESGYLYRVNRHDIEPAIPLCDPLPVQMAYCQEHHLRVLRRWGTYPVEPDGRMRTLPGDIIEHRAIRFGTGWHVLEKDESGPFRWVSERAELFLSDEDPLDDVLELDVESHPFDDGSWIELACLDFAGRELHRTTVRGRQRVAVPLLARGALSIVVTGGPDFREKLPPHECRDELRYWAHNLRLRSHLRDATTVAAVTTGPASEPTGVAIPLSFLKPTSSAGIITVQADSTAIIKGGVSGGYMAEWLGRAPASGVYSFGLEHSNSAGQVGFGVLSESRSRWMARAAPTESDPTSLVATVELLHDEAFWLVVSDCSNDGVDSQVVIRRLSVDGPLAALVPASGKPTATEWRRRIPGGISRRLVPRLPKKLREDVVAASDRLASLRARQKRLEEEVTALEVTSAGHEARALQLAPLGMIASHDTFLRENRPDCLHLNGCGDFQLMAQEHWFALSAYPELETFSMSIDGLLSHIAHSAGITERVLDEPCCIYHLEHGTGSGWTPEGEQALRRRIDERGISWVDATTVTTWAAYMKWLGRPLLFNLHDWGLAKLSFSELVISAELPRRPPARTGERNGC